jgi:type VI secretion system protein ImpE
MTARQLFEAGRVRDAERALSAHLRDHPQDVSQRIFLFELLCFSGDYDRAEKQLSVLARDGADAELGAVLYYSALHAEKTRHELFRKEEFPRAPAPSASPGVLNGKGFSKITDADAEIGARLEVFAAGSYLWVPFAHITSIEIPPPRNLRDTLWAPALVRTGRSFGGHELGEVLLPATYAFSWRHPDEPVWLGRMTGWMADEESNEYPMGQKLLVVDGEEVPLLEVRRLDFQAGDAAAT